MFKQVMHMRSLTPEEAEEMEAWEDMPDSEWDRAEQEEDEEEDDEEEEP
jgi:hypothetical protein